MPFTPYHFGPSGFLGLLFRKWVDLPVFVLANVAVDVEVLVIVIFGLGQPVHRYGHTLLGGAVVGVVWGLAAYPLRGTFRRAMESARLKYETSLLKMIVSGVLGVWLHVLIDGIYHFDVRPFWPNEKISLWQIIMSRIGYHHTDVLKSWVEWGCAAFLIAAVVLYMLIVHRELKSRHAGTRDWRS